MEKIIFQIYTYFLPKKGGKFLFFGFTDASIDNIYRVSIKNLIFRLLLNFQSSSFPLGRGFKLEYINNDTQTTGLVMEVTHANLLYIWCHDDMKTTLCIKKFDWKWCKFFTLSINAVIEGIFLNLPSLLPATFHLT